MRDRAQCVVAPVCYCDVQPARCQSVSLRSVAGISVMTNIYVGNLPYTTTEAELEQVFSPHGEVSRASVITDRETGRSRGFGFIEMPNDEEAAAAIEALNGSDFGDRSLVVNVARPKER